MTSPIRFLSWILGVVFTLGLADSFAHLTYKTGKAAIRAHMHDQMSCTRYNQLLWGQTARHNKSFDLQIIIEGWAIPAFLMTTIHAFHILIKKNQHFSVCICQKVLHTTPFQVRSQRVNLRCGSN